MYVGVGVGYNVRVQGMAPAPSSHPHYYSWTQLGGLIVDGALFFKAQVLSRERGGGYETLVEEARKTSDSVVAEAEDDDEELPE
jgi:hypothetical protein|eukprot:COSAG02_NODE_10835_length_1848_cov_2.188107_1_plen_84_part_00